MTDLHEYGELADMTANGTDTAGVIAPPPLIFAGFLALGLGLELVLPAAVLPLGLRFPVGGAMIALAVAIVMAGFRAFGAAGTPVKPHEPTTAIATTGPFRYSRNPLYVSLALIHGGIAIAADSPWALATLAPSLIVIRYGVIAREERYLERKFGDGYLAYKARVRRWF